MSGSIVPSVPTSGGWLYWTLAGGGVNMAHARTWT